MDLLRAKQGKKGAGFITLCVSVTILLGLAGCYNDKEEILYPGSTTPVDCSAVPAKFAPDVLPLITSKCAIPGCHDQTASGGIIFKTYSQVSTKKDRINTRVVLEKTMPPSGPLLPAEISKIKCWLDAGALNN